MPTHQPAPTTAQLQIASTAAIASEIEAAIVAKKDHSQHALGIVISARHHFERFGEKPKLRGLVSTSHWPIVLTAQPVGIGRVVTKYIITSEGDVTLERSYTRSHVDTTRESNVFTSIPPRL